MSPTEPRVPEPRVTAERLRTRLSEAGDSCNATICPECRGKHCGNARVCATCHGSRSIVSVRRYDRLHRIAVAAVALSRSLAKAVEEGRS